MNRVFKKESQIILKSTCFSCDVSPASCPVIDGHAAVTPMTRKGEMEKDNG